MSARRGRRAARAGGRCGRAGRGRGVGVAPLLDAGARGRGQIAARGGENPAWSWGRGARSGALARPWAAAPTLSAAGGPPPRPARWGRAPTPGVCPGGQRGVGGQRTHARDFWEVPATV